MEKHVDEVLNGDANQEIVETINFLKNNKSGIKTELVKSGGDWYSSWRISDIAKTSGIA